MSQKMKSPYPIHIHAHFGGTSSTMAMVMSHMLDIPWSMTCHRWDIYEDNILAVKSQSASFVRFISRKGLADAVGFGVIPDKAVYIPMGVNRLHVSAARSLSERVPVIACAANLVEVKGHRYLLEAVSMLKQDGFPVQLDLFGDGPLRMELEVMVRQLDITDRVKFWGNLAHEALQVRYANNEIDLFVLPSIDLGGGHHEGVPVSIMEAMSYGIPVISTRTGSIEEILEPSFNSTVPGKNPTALKIAIKNVLSNPDVYRIRSKQVIECIREKWMIQGSVMCMKSYIETY